MWSLFPTRSLEATDTGRNIKVVCWEALLSIEYDVGYTKSCIQALRNLDLFMCQHFSFTWNRQPCQIKTFLVPRVKLGFIVGQVLWLNSKQLTNFIHGEKVIQDSVKARRIRAVVLKRVSTQKENVWGFIWGQSVSVCLCVDFLQVIWHRSKIPKHHFTCTGDFNLFKQMAV